jgi:transposase
MVKSNKSVAQHLGGIKGNLFTERLESANLEKTMVVPIDIGKNSHKAMIANYFGSVLHSPFEFDNSKPGVTLFHKQVSSLAAHLGSERILVAMEATGHYYQNLSLHLQGLGYETYILNPISTKRCREAGLTWSKTDEKDLVAIGQALISAYATPLHLQEPVWASLKIIERQRRYQIKHQTAFKNKTHAILDSLCPGISEVDIFKEGHLWDNASMDFLMSYSTPTQIIRLGSQRALNFFRRRGRRLNKLQTDQLIQWAKNALTHNRPETPTMEYILSLLLRQLSRVGEDIRLLEIELVKNLVQIPPVLLLSIDYIGPVTAGEFGGEISPLSQYRCARSVIKGAGLDPVSYQSSNYEAPNHPISGKGSSPLRYISIDIGDRLMKNNEHFSSFANRLIGRGKSENCACVAVTGKFIRIAFSMIKELKPFRPSTGLGIAKDPLRKIEQFLIQRKAPELVDSCIQSAKFYLKGA